MTRPIWTRITNYIITTFSYILIKLRSNSSGNETSGSYAFSEYYMYMCSFILMWLYAHIQCFPKHFASRLHSQLQLIESLKYLFLTSYIQLAISYALYADIYQYRQQVQLRSYIVRIPVANLGEGLRRLQPPPSVTPQGM